MWVSLGFMLAREVLSVIKRVERDKRGEAGSTKLATAEDLVRAMETNIVGAGELTPTEDLAAARQGFIIAAVRYLNAIARTR